MPRMTWTPRRQLILLGGLIALAGLAALWVSAPETGTSLAAGPAGPGVDPDRDRANVAAPAEPAERAAVPGPATSTEPVDPNAPLSSAEAEALQVEVPFGTLEVLVLRGRTPQANVPLTVHGRMAGAAPADFEALGAAGHTGVTDRQGLARFVGLGPDSYTVRATLADGARMEISALHAQRRHVRAVIPFGQRRLVGAVHDDDGAPVADCEVTVRIQLEGLAFQSNSVSARTDQSGRYELYGLPSTERAFVECGCLPAGTLPGERMRATSLDVPERRVDFGVAGGAPRWRGLLLDSEGRPIRFAGKLSLRRLEDDQLAQVAFDDEGAIDAGLAPGAYVVQHAGLSAPVALGQIEIGWGGLNQDLVLPGTRVEVELTWAGTPVDERLADDVLARQLVTLSATRELPGGPPAGQRASARAFFGVAPGTYWLRSQPNPLMGGQPLRVEVRAGSVVERVSATLVDP